MEKMDADELSSITEYLFINPTFREYFEIRPSSGLQKIF